MDDQSLPDAPHAARLELEAILKAAARRMAIIAVASGALAVASSAGAAALAAFAADRWTQPPSLLRFAIAAAFVIVTVAFLYARVVVALLRPPDARAAAVKLERSYGALGGFALSAAELAVIESRSSAPSGELVGMTVAEAARRARSIDVSQAVPAAGLARPLAAAACVVLAWTVVAWKFPEDARTFLERFARPFAAISYPARTRIVAVRAPSVLALGSTFEAEAVAAGALPEEAVFHVRPASGPERNIYRAGVKGRYSLALEGVRESFEFYVEAADATSPERSVRVVDRPETTAIGADVEYPAYTGMGTLNVASGNIKALSGSHVRLKVAFNKPVVTARLLFSDGRNLAGALAADARSTTFSFEVAESATYNIVPRDEYGFECADAASYQVIPEPDSPPTATLQRPDRDLDAVEDAVIPVEFSAADDYEIVSVALHYTIARAGAKGVEQRVRLADPVAKSASALYRWSLKGLGVRPGDEVSYYVAATDNLPVAPQSGRSETRKVTVVTVAQKLAEIDRMSHQLQLNLQAAARKQQETRDAVTAAAGMEARQ